MSKFVTEHTRVAVLGLGYVGLPLAVEFSRKYLTIGFDTDQERISELQRGVDRTGEIDDPSSLANDKLLLSSDQDDLYRADFFVVAVPTPIDRLNQPDLSLLRFASEIVGRHLSPGNLVVFESTVFPGATEGVCVPILEKYSKLKCNEDFFVGYSPERINPGDKLHRLPAIVKVTSGSTPYAAELVDEMYRSIIPAGTYKAESIRVAEAAKVIENTQRDLNVALMNELAKIFNLMGIDTDQVLAAAGTKWNFLPFRPGLVGGHCISIDPYYLTHEAKRLGYSPEIILAGRKLNDGMGHYVVERVEALMRERQTSVDGASVLVLGFAFKENCSDTRNTRVIDIVEGFKRDGASVEVWDPRVRAEQVEEEYGLSLVDQPVGPYDAIVLAVAHDELIAFESRLAEISRENAVVFDVKSAWAIEATHGRL